MTSAPDARAPGRIIVKIGGSLAEAGMLASVLERLVAQRGRSHVIVPGGGRFADAVRDAQRHEGFSDAAAHRMAILAMHQMAEIYFQMQPGLVPAEDLGEIEEALARGRVPVWLPYRLASRSPDIPQDWSMTSDGLAAWLAGRWTGAAVVLLKACDADPAASLDALLTQGIVDPVFARIVEGAKLPWCVAGPDRFDELWAGTGLLAAG